jgi:hypothetical protein
MHAHMHAVACTNAFVVVVCARAQNVHVAGTEYIVLHNAIHAILLGESPPAHAIAAALPPRSIRAPECLSA